MVSVAESKAASASVDQVIGLFGGTFDPIHNGHLRMALEFKQSLSLDEMRLLPCHRPPHRETPSCTSSDRAEMVRLALQGRDTGLVSDERELQSERPSYTLDSLTQLRDELGDNVSLCWCVGMDSLVNLHTWSRWESLLDFAHLLVAARPGWSMPESGAIAHWLDQNLTTDRDHLRSAPCGSVLVVEQSLLDISATSIRQQIEQGYSPEFLLPDAVWRYIKTKGLYRPS